MGLVCSRLLQEKERALSIDKMTHLDPPTFNLMPTDFGTSLQMGKKATTIKTFCFVVNMVTVGSDLRPPSQDTQ